MRDSAKDPVTSVRSPFAGCAILIAAVAVMVFLIGFSVLTLFRQFAEIAKFTSDRPSPVPISEVENREGEINLLTERIEMFRQQLASDERASLALSVDDLNLAIASYESFKELRGTFRVSNIDSTGMEFAISFPLNGRPRFANHDEPGWIASDSRFLNGRMLAIPKLLKHEVALAISTINVDGAKVPLEFVDQMSPYRITERYLNDSQIGPAMAKLTRVELKPGELVLVRNPGEVRADHISNEQVDKASVKLFTTIGIAACIFLAFAGTIILIGARAKTRKNGIS